MPKKNISSYRLHKPTGQAIVSLRGKMFYLGQYKSKESRAKYNEIIADYLANDSKLPPTRSTADLTVEAGVFRFLEYAEGYYVKNGKPTATGEDLGIPLVGIVDLVLDGMDGLVVVDFKTAASASSNCELQHEIQLTAYAYLVREVFRRNESALEIRQLVKTKTPKIVVHRFPPRSEEHFRRFFGIVREYLDSLDRGVFNYRPGFGCMMCDQAGICVS